MDEELRLLAAGYTDATEVVLLWWPANALDGARLAAEGIAVLYLVAADADPPTTQNFLTDWARLPAEPRDLRVRVSSLDARRASLEAPPRVDQGDHLRYRGRFLSLPADEAGLAALLVDHFGCVVSDRTIEAEAALSRTRSPSCRGRWLPRGSLTSDRAARVGRFRTVHLTRVPGGRVPG